MNTNVFQMKHSLSGTVVNPVENQQKQTYCLELSGEEEEGKTSGNGN